MMKRKGSVQRTRRLVLAAACWGIWGCEPSPPAGGDGADGADGAVGAAQGSTWQVDEEFRLGVAEGEGPDLFGEIRAVAVDGDGTIVVVDGQANDVRRFSPAGRHQWTVGRAGAGPAEFQAVVGAAFSPAGDLWVVDARNARFTVIDPEGRSRSLPRVSRWARQPWIGGFGPEGRIHELSTVQGPGPDGLVDQMLAMDGEGSLLSEDRIPRDQPPRPTVGGGIMTSLPFEPVVLRAWDPAGGLWQALSSEYRIVRIDLEGDTTAVVAQPTPLLSFSTAEQDSLQAGVRRAEQMGAAVEAGMIPEALPPLRWMTVDDRGQLWVCATGRDPCRNLDIFDGTGNRLGSARLPAVILDLPRPVIRNGRFHAAVEGPDGEPQLLVGRVVEPALTPPTSPTPPGASG